MLLLKPLFGFAASTSALTVLMVLLVVVLLLPWCCSDAARLLRTAGGMTVARWCPGRLTERSTRCRAATCGPRSSGASA